MSTGAIGANHIWPVDRHGSYVPVREITGDTKMRVESPWVTFSCS